MAGNVEMVRVLLKCGADGAARMYGHGFTSFHLAARGGHADVVKELGKHDRDLLNCPATSAGGTLCLEDTALYIAIKGDFASVVVVLCHLGSDLMARSKNGRNIAQIAVDAGSLKVIAVLAKLSPVLFHEKEFTTENLLYCAAKAGRQNVMQLIMSIMKLKIDDKLAVNDNLHGSNTSTLLHLAAKHRDKGVISILAGDFGADVEATDSEGRCWHEDFEDKGVNNWPFFHDFSLDEYSDKFTVKSSKEFAEDLIISMYIAIGNRNSVGLSQILNNLNKVFKYHLKMRYLHSIALLIKQDAYAGVGRALSNAAKAGMGRVVVEFMKEVPLIPYSVIKYRDALFPCVQGKIQFSVFSGPFFVQIDPKKTEISSAKCQGSWMGFPTKQRRSEHDSGVGGERTIRRIDVRSAFHSKALKGPSMLSNNQTKVWASIARNSILKIVWIMLATGVSWRSAVDGVWGRQEVAGHMVIISGLCNLDTLRGLVNHASSGTSVELFENASMRANIKALWGQLWPGIYFRGAYYMFLVVAMSLFGTYCIGSGMTRSDVLKSQGPPIWFFCLACIVQTLNLYLLIREIRQLFVDGIYEYFGFWNVCQMSAHTLVPTTLILFVIEIDSVTLRSICAFTILLLWTCVLYFLKASKRISFLIEMLVSIVRDLGPFLVVMSIIMLGVTVSMIVITGSGADHHTNDMNSDFFDVLFKVVRLAEGRMDVEDAEALGLTDPTLIRMYRLLVMVLLFFITVVALNALIALMSSTYERIMEKKVSERYKQLALMCLDEMELLPKDTLEKLGRGMKWTHILSPSSDGHIPDPGQELWEGKQDTDWSGQMDSLKRSFEIRFKSMEFNLESINEKLARILQLQGDSESCGIQRS